MILVAGGGIAGAACAILLAEQGRAVTLVERQPGPTHKICGEFVSGEALGYLNQLGLDLPALGGERVSHVRLLRGSQMISAPLPFRGLGLTRKTLDEALLTRAAQAGVTIHRGHAIRKISFDAGIGVEIDQCGTLHTQMLMLATGKHETRGVLRIARPSRLVGFKTYFRLSTTQLAALSNHVELILFRGGYAGLQRVENGATNLSMLIESATLHRLGGKWQNVMDYLRHESPHLAARLADAVELLPDPLTIARMPFGFTYRPQTSDPSGLFRVGDQAAVIHSFTGDGMAIALHSAVLATRYALAGQTAQNYHRRFRADTYAQIKRAGLLYSLVATPWLRPALFAAAAFWPSALANAAAWTRVSGKAMAEAS